jgi:hypothetical protein
VVVQRRDLGDLWTRKSAAASAEQIESDSKIVLKNENVLIKGINEEYLSDVCGYHTWKGGQDGPSY